MKNMRFCGGIFRCFFFFERGDRKKGLNWWMKWWWILCCFWLSKAIELSWTWFLSPLNHDAKFMLVKSSNIPSLGSGLLAWIFSGISWLSWWTLMGSAPIHPSNCSTPAGAVENMGDAKLCKPSVWKTFLASLISTAFVFVGLLLLGITELGIQNFHKEVWSTLALRCIGWSFLFYIPIHVASVPPLGRIMEKNMQGVLNKRGHRIWLW